VRALCLCGLETGVFKAEAGSQAVTLMDVLMTAHDEFQRFEIEILRNEKLGKEIGTLFTI